MCGQARTCCDCLGKKINGVAVCVFDVARKRQSGACIPAAARRREVFDVEAIADTLDKCPCGDGAACGTDEQCDEGANNGKPGSCCSATCRFVSSGTVCRASAGVCDTAESCPGNSGKCPGDAFASSRTVCRASAAGKDCDKPENCDGRSANCPADSAWDSSRVCRAARAPCDAEERCDGRSFDCPATDAIKPKDAVCRPAQGACDIAEVCDGSSTACPQDAFKNQGVVCEAVNGICDVEDVCSGTSPACPRSFQPNSVVCRAAAGVCDREERCSGSSSSCPGDARESNGKVCRAQDGVCDVEERCNGRDADCPSDAVRGRGTECRRATDVCDEREACDGSTKQCPSDAFKPQGVECAAAGNCELASLCSGTSVGCAARAKKPLGANCTSTSACFADQTCQADGSCGGGRFVCDCQADGDCKSDNVCGVPFCDRAVGKCKLRAAANSVVCRQKQGDCDLETKCDGRATTCPPPAFQPSSRVCRASTGTCDVEEKCTGSSADCPADAFAAADKICRASSGPCDAAEFCSGTSNQCPSDARLAAGMACVSADKCVAMSACTQNGTCVGSNVCECQAAADCWPLAARKRGTLETLVRVEDPCTEYACVSNVCRVSPRKSCNIVPRCEPGTGGCTCGANRACAAPFKCNSTSLFCEDNRCGIAGLPGCQCANQACSDVTRKRQDASYLRCSSGMCRIETGRKPTVAPCTVGTLGCACGPSGACSTGVCAANVCTADCPAGTAGCSCNLKAAALCTTNGTVCDLTSRCVFFNEDCGKQCKLGEPGCCCLADRSCADVGRKRDVFVNTCSSNNICLIEVLPGQDPRVKCGTRKVGATWSSDAGLACRCLETGEQCDKSDACFTPTTQLACHKTAGCVWSSAAPHNGVCQTTSDAPGKTNGACTAGMTCELGTDRCNVDTFTCESTIATTVAAGTGGSSTQIDQVSADGSALGSSVALFFVLLSTGL